MNTAAKALIFALDNLQGRTGFSSTGASPFFFPDLAVEGIGEIAFPLSAQQAHAFTRLAEAAPYGKGTKTKHDERVRKCWQLDAKHFSFKAKAWNQYLKATLAKISEDLGITGKISAKPYKLLLYGPGGHFKAHRDTEKLDAMFGTLIVALPSRHEGGQLHIRHGGEKVTVDFSAEAHRHDFQHAAFFADCEHEVVPVKSGYRFCVVFNLVLEEGDPASLSLTAEDFSKVDPDEKAGEGYTGNAGCTMEYWYRRAAVVLWPQGCDEEARCAKNMTDACESLLSMSTGKKTGPGSPFDKLAKAAIRVMGSQDDSQYHGYRHLDTDIRLPVTRLAFALASAKRADLVEKLASELPPSRLASCPPAVWRQLFSVCAPETFAAVFKHWLKSPEDFRKPLFATLAGLCAKRSQAPWVSRIAAALARLKPVEISKWDAQKSRDPIPPGDLDESKVIFAASRRLTQKADIAAAIAFLKSDGSLFAVRKLIGPLFTSSANKTLLAESAVANELLLFCKDALAKEIARPLVPYPDWCRPCPPVPKERYPQHFYSRKEPHIPVLEELAAFMADPATKELAIRRREDQRMIAEEFIRTHFLDLDCKTLRQGTPHTLHCTKNDRSYQHEREWRKKDEIMLRELQKC